MSGNVKSVISIGVDDSAFDSFSSKFSSYLGELDKQQEKWEAAGRAMGLSAEALSGGALTAKDSLAVAAAQAGVISEALRDSVKAQSDLGSATKSSAGHMDKLRKGAEGVGGAIKSIGGWIIKLGAIGGLGGLLSGLGIADLAGAAFSRSKAAGSLGLSTGQLSSFQVNAQQFLGTDALRGAIAAQSDVSKWGAFSALGLDPQAAIKEDPVKLSFDALSKATERYNQDKKTGLAYGSDPILQMYTSMLGGNIGDVRNSAMHPGEANKAYRNYLADQQALEIPKQQQQEWANLKIELDRAGATIETVFITKLSALAPEFETLGKALTNFVSTVLSSPNTKIAIDSLAKGLHGLGDYLSSKAFMNDLKAMGDGIHAVAQGMRAVGWVADKVNQGADAIEQSNAPILGKGMQFADILPGIGNFFSSSGKDISQAYRGAAKTIFDVAKKYGVDPVLALATAANESGLNPLAQGDKNKRGGFDSHGLFQLNRYGEGAGMTLAQMNDPTINTQTALSRFVFLQKMGEKYTENVFSKAVHSAATHYDANGNPLGPNVTHAQIAALFGTKGMESAASQRPSDPYDYAIRINNYYKALLSQQHKAIKQVVKPLKQRAPKNQTSLTIFNSTSARVVVGVNAVATA